MVCPRCIEKVTSIADELNIPYNKVSLGQLSTSIEIKEKPLAILGEVLIKNGFQLLETNKAKLVNRIKSIIIEEIHFNKGLQKQNFSELITSKLHHDYAYLSRIFSSVEGITIERYLQKQKIERIKELLDYNELTLSEIASSMGYSSVAHLSNQFKKETGIRPSEYKKSSSPDRKSLDQL